MSMYTFQITGIRPVLELINPFSDVKTTEKITEKWNENTISNKLQIFGLIIFAGLASIPGALIFSPLIFRTIVIKGLENVPSKQDIDTDSALLANFANETTLDIKNPKIRNMLTAIDHCYQMCEGIPAFDKKTGKLVKSFNIIIRNLTFFLKISEEDRPTFTTESTVIDQTVREAVKILLNTLIQQKQHLSQNEIINCFNYYIKWIGTHQDSKPWETCSSWDNTKRKPH